MPDTASLSYYQKLNDQWDILGDVTWTGWSSIPELRIVRTDGPAVGASTVLPENFKDTWRFSAGFNYQYNEKTVLRAGVAYDQSPVNDTDRSARLPDSDRTWLTVGGRFKYSTNLNFDVGAAYIWVKDGSINNAGNPGNRARPMASSTATSTTTSSWCRRRPTIGGSRLRLGRRPGVAGTQPEPGCP